MNQHKMGNNFQLAVDDTFRGEGGVPLQAVLLWCMTYVINCLQIKMSGLAYKVK